MKKFMFAGASSALITTLSFCSFAQQTPSAAGVPVSVIVTAEARHGKEVPRLDLSDIKVLQGKDQRPVMSLVPLGEQSNSGTQLLVLISDSARPSLDVQINTLKQFITALPSSTEVAVGYMRNGTNQMASDFTRDHKAAADAIRLVSGPGGADVSPYDSLSEAIKRWPASGAERREVIMIGSGIEGLDGSFTTDNPYVNRAIDDAQRAGIVVYTIYTPGEGHYGHAMWRANWGQNFLSQLSDETGGESYMVGFGAPVSLQPFLDQITEQMKHQYRLTFEARPEKKAGLQPLRVTVIEKNASIAAPDKVYVKAGM